MNKKILACGLDGEQKDLLMDLCSQKGFDYIFAYRDQDDLLVKEILNGDGNFEKGEIHSEVLIMFAGAEQNEIIDFIESYKKVDLPKPLFCMVTEHNLNWRLKELLDHLVKEREEVKRYMQNRNNNK